MDDKAYIGLVYAHAEGVGGHNDGCFPFHPPHLGYVAFFGLHTGMVIGGGDAVSCKGVRHLECATPVAHIDYPAAAGVAGNTQHAPLLVLLAKHHVGKIGTVETGLVHMLFSPEQ